MSPFDRSDVEALDPPQGWSGMRTPSGPVLPHSTRPVCAISVRSVASGERGYGVWNIETGHLEHFHSGAREFQWLGDGARAVTLEGDRDGSFFRHWEVDGWRRIGELFIPRGFGGCEIEHIRLSPSGDWITTHRHSGQGEWGYDVVRVSPLAHCGGISSMRGYLAEAPQFELDETQLIGGYGSDWNGGWWAHPEDNGDDPARGGHVTFGWLFVHRLRDGAVSWHELKMQIPEGYLPEDQYAETWAGPSAIAPFGKGFRMTLPGGAPFEMDEELPGVIELPLPSPKAVSTCEARRRVR